MFGGTVLRKGYIPSSGYKTKTEYSWNSLKVNKNILFGCNPNLCWNGQAGRPALYPTQVGIKLQPPQGKARLPAWPRVRCQLPKCGCSDLRKSCTESCDPNDNTISLEQRFLHIHASRDLQLLLLFCHEHSQKSMLWSKRVKKYTRWKRLHAQICFLLLYRFPGNHLVLIMYWWSVAVPYTHPNNVVEPPGVQNSTWEIKSVESFTKGTVSVTLRTGKRNNLWSICSHWSVNRIEPEWLVAISRFRESGELNSSCWVITPGEAFCQSVQDGEHL